MNHKNLYYKIILLFVLFNLEITWSFIFVYFHINQIFLNNNYELKKQKYNNYEIFQFNMLFWKNY